MAVYQQSFEKGEFKVHSSDFTTSRRGDLTDKSGYLPMGILDSFSSSESPAVEDLLSLSLIIICLSNQVSSSISRSWVPCVTSRSDISVVKIWGKPLQIAQN